MKYSLRDRVLFALLVLPDVELPQLLRLFDSVAAAPLRRTNASFRDTAGRRGYVCAAGQFRLYYFVARDGHVTFTDLRQDTL